MSQPDLNGALFYFWERRGKIKKAGMEGGKAVTILLSLVYIIPEIKIIEPLQRIFPDHGFEILCIGV